MSTNSCNSRSLLVVFPPLPTLLLILKCTTLAHSPPPPSFLSGKFFDVFLIPRSPPFLTTFIYPWGTTLPRSRRPHKYVWLNQADVYDSHLRANGFRFGPRMAVVNLITTGFNQPISQYGTLTSRVSILLTVWSRCGRYESLRAVVHLLLTYHNFF